MVSVKKLLENASDEERKFIKQRITEWHESEKEKGMGIKKYFDEPQEIIGWIVAALGLALAIASFFVDALPVAQSVAIGTSMVLAGVGLVAKKLLKYAAVAVDLLEEIAERQRKGDKRDGE